MRRWITQYTWDPYGLTYVPVPFRWRSLWRQGKLWMIGMGLGLLLFAGGYRWWADYFIQREKVRLHQLDGHIRQLERKWQEAEARLDYLYVRQGEFYAPIVGAHPISEGAWMGGTGGAAPASAQDRTLYRAQLLQEAYEKLHHEILSRQEALRRYPYAMPIQGTVTSGFGYRRDPFHGHWQMHTGVDINAPYGAPVRATASGVVIYADWDKGGGYGIQVEINHFNGFVTKYAHLSRVAVKAGDTVARGDVVGYVGSTGYSVAPHLHYEVIQNGVKLDPRKFLPL